MTTCCHAVAFASEKVLPMGEGRCSSLLSYSLTGRYRRRRNSRVVLGDTLY